MCIRVRKERSRNNRREKIRISELKSQRGRKEQKWKEEKEKKSELIHEEINMR